MKRTSLNSCRLLISAFLVASLLTPELFCPAIAQDSSAIAQPPVARVRPVVDDYFGTKVTDPYRYMEHLDNPEVAAWMKAQNAYTRRVLGRISGRDELLARIEQLDKSVPALVGGITRLATGRYFYGSARQSGQTRILRGFPESDEFGLGGCQALCLQQQIVHVSITAAAA